jgi:hypothetical protein
MDNKRRFITIVHVGNVAGSFASQVYLAAGKTVECQTLSNLEQHGALPYS